MAIKKKNKLKRCPLIDQDCLKDGCELYHEDFDRCKLDLIAYNLYGLIAALKNLPKQGE